VSRLLLRNVDGEKAGGGGASEGGAGVRGGEEAAGGGEGEEEGGQGQGWSSNSYAGVFMLENTSPLEGGGWK
jgi:hypothetical protein